MMACLQAINADVSNHVHATACHDWAYADLVRLLDADPRPSPGHCSEGVSLELLE